MSQVIFDTIDPESSGEELADILNDFKNAVVSGFIGTSRPTNLGIGGGWVDNTNDPTSWTLKIWTGTTDVSIFTLDLVAGVASVALAVDAFTIKKISADTVGAVLELVKRRIAVNGQVSDGDVVGEIRVVGRTATSGNPVVAKIIFTSSDNMTSSAYGGTLSFYSTPDATATLTEHMRFISGYVETIVPHKLNSQILVSQNVSTTATIAQLSASKVVVEMTGSTATSIQGLNSAHDSKVVTIHNRSTALVTIKHQDSGASAADRFKLPSSLDISIPAEGTATFYYCTTDTFWKILSSSDRISGFTIDTVYGAVQTWTAPATVSQARITAFRAFDGGITERSGMVDFFGNAYSWGVNANGQLGVGDVTPRSSPVAVLGGLQFDRTYGTTAAATASYAIANNGSAYAWGINTNGQLGVAADVVPRSSPVAVLGGLKFVHLHPRDASCFGLTTNGLAYAWGINTNGQLGLGDVTPRSAPVAVLRGLTFARMTAASGASGSSAAVAIDRTGALYAWGINTNGNLGVGDVAARSSPVAVLGGLTFSSIRSAGISTRYFCVGLNSSGAAYAWGANTNSNLGVGDQTPRSSPVAVLGGLTFGRLVTQEKSETVFGFNTSSALYSWGENTKGTLGVGDAINRSSPVAVVGGITFKNIRLFKQSAFGITSDGTLYSWGDNTNGQLGLGDVAARSSPVAVLGGLKFSEVFFADGPTDVYSVYGVTTSGAVYSWGSNTNGTLGLGDVTPRSSPVAVLGAFSPNPVEDTTTIDITVTPSASYTVVTGPGLSSFGQFPIGKDVYKVEIEYLQ